MNKPSARLAALARLYLFERDNARRAHDEAVGNLDKARSQLQASQERQDACVLHAQQVKAPGAVISIGMLLDMRRYMAVCEEEVSMHSRHVQQVREEVENARKELLLRQGRLKGLERLQERRIAEEVLEKSGGDQRELDRQAAELAAELSMTGPIAVGVQVPAG